MDVIFISPERNENLLPQLLSPCRHASQQEKTCSLSYTLTRWVSQLVRCWAKNPTQRTQCLRYVYLCVGVRLCARCRHFIYSNRLQPCIVKWKKGSHTNSSHIHPRMLRRERESVKRIVSATCNSLTQRATEVEGKKERWSRRRRITMTDWG